MIRPLSLPSAAGTDRGNGDVRHFAVGDSLSVPGLAGPTRELAERDNLLASKLNETIAAVNNKEQFVPLPVLRTTLPPNDEAVVTNYRIPAGFEARILNAAIASTPISSDTELNIYYATGFGNVTGTALVTTSGENTSGTSFKQDGEFIVSIKNKGGVTLDVVASILLTMRPIGEVGTLLVGSVIRGERGEPGQTGPQGIQGIPGTGGQGSPGMIWTGAWTNGRGYSTKEVASFALYGTVVSSYICEVAHTANTTNQPPATTYWSPVAVGSSGSVVGVQGPVGPAGGVPTYAVANLSGTVVPDGDYVGGIGENGYSGGGAAYGTTLFTYVQSSIDSGTQTSPKGVAFLVGTFRRSYTGNMKIFLPQVTPEGAKVNWDTSNVVCQASINGSYGMRSFDTVQVSAESLTQYHVRVKDAAAQKVSITLHGIQAIV